MCQAQVLRFQCHHGLLMSIDTCSLAPCASLKTTSSAKLPQQPGRCYKCESKKSSKSQRPSSGDSSCESSIGSFQSTSSTRSLLTRAATAPLPNVARQPMGTLQYCTTNIPGRQRSSSSRSFNFACPTSCSHNTSPHYNMLPSYLPHQEHPCPPCQLTDLQVLGDKEAVHSAKREFPHLTSDMLVRNGRQREDWEHTLTLEKYIDEKRLEEKQMWWIMTRKWTQDLKSRNVLVAEEDGLGLRQ